MGYANEIHEKYESEVRLVTVSFKKSLATGQYLTGQPTVQECSNELFFDNIVVNDETLVLSEDTPHEETVYSGQAVQFTVASGDAVTLYDMEVVCSTDGVTSPAQTIMMIAPLKVIRK